MKMKNMVLVIMVCFLIFISMSCICACDDADVANTRDVNDIIVDDAIDDSIDVIDDGASSAAEDIDDSGSSADDSSDLIDDGASSDASIDVNDGDSIIKNMTRNVPKYNNEPISNVKDGGNSFGDVQKLIDNLPAASVLFLSKDYTMQKGESPILISMDITINGDGHTLNADGNGRIIEITEGKVFLKNLVLINGSAKEEGGAIYVLTSSKIASGLICEKVQFIDNHAKKYGGAVWARYTLPVDYTDCYDIPINFTDCTFRFNSVTDGTSSGGAIYSYDKMNVNNCYFKNNEANRNGDGCAGAILARKDLNIIDSTFYKNYAHGSAAVHASERCNVKNSVFEENYAHLKWDQVCSHAGAIHAYVITIDSSKFYYNKADSRAGAIYTETSAKLVGDNEFIGNEAHDYGGVIYAYYGDVTVNWDDNGKTTFRGNRANSDSGGVIYSKKNVYVGNVVFDSNFAEDDGGAIFSEGNTYVNWDRNSETIFKYNRANTDDGGSIYSKGNVYVKNADFSYGYAHDGGAIYACGNTIIDSSVFNVNNASHQGGAIYEKSGLSLRGRTSFAANEAKDSGGAIYTRKFDEDVYHATFRYNVAGDDGGAIYIDHENHETFTECDFEDNYAGDEGGAIYLDDGDSHLSLKRNNLVNNKAKSGYTVYNHGVYDDIKDNWHGSASPNFDNQFKKYRLILKDLVITPSSYAKARISW